MKKATLLFLFSLSVFLVPISLFGQEFLTFSVKEIMIPTLEEGKLGEATFAFTNTSDTIVVITNVRGSCGCTVAKWPKQAIKSEEKGEIKVVYNSLNRPGYYVKSIKVSTNVDKEPFLLKVKGMVRKKKPAGGN